jgi:hypothetical protein
VNCPVERTPCTSRHRNALSKNHACVCRASGWVCGCSRPRSPAGPTRPVKTRALSRASRAPSPSEPKVAIGRVESYNQTEIILQLDGIAHLPNFHE